MKIISEGLIVWRRIGSENGGVGDAEMEGSSGTFFFSFLRIFWEPDT